MVYYQPKVKPETGVVTGVEALVRWKKSDGIIVNPDDFIPLAEETGLITRLGNIVIEDACKAMQDLNNIGCGELKMSVNLSPFQFEQANLVTNILSIVNENDMPVSQFELEITETTMMTNLQDTVAKLHLLVDAGVSISIDDFGTGYSSLYYLKSFPIDTLKIDRSFIKDIPTDPNGAQLVETIILMAHNLGIGVVAEGVETKEQLEILKDFQCDLIQGYYYSPPLPLEGLIEYLTPHEGVLSSVPP
jgi:EAL domain-containing protein (putative c-di-GMP-specific phosphodiesterase class I)